MARQDRAHARDPLALADDVLAGRVRPSARALMDLVHALNPTGRGLPPREEQRRYALKSRIQSVLIERFGAELHIAPVHAELGVVAIAHRHSGADACHAVIGSLDDAARSFVQRGLDAGAFDADDASTEPSRMAESSRARGAAARRDSPTDENEGSPALERGRAALEVYDYDTARLAFEAAYAESAGGEAEARALLELLVDVLGDDGSACSLAVDLGDDAAGDPTACALIALAFARRGDARSAQQWLPRAEPARAADVRAQIAKLHALEREPIERDLRDAMEVGATDRVATLAAEILRTWPDSELALSVIRAIRRGERRARADDALGRARACLTAGDLTAASRAAEEADRNGVDVATIRAEIDHAREQARQARLDERVLEVAALAEAGQVAEAARGYLDLPERARPSVRALATAGGLRWVDAALGLKPRPTPEEIVTAASALESARVHAQSGEVLRAAALIQPVGRLVRGLPDARAWLASARAVEGDRRRAEATAGVEDAKRAYDAGDVERARALVSSIERDDLTSDVQQQLLAFDAELSRSVTLRTRSARVEKFRASRDLFAARDEIDALLGGAAGIDAGDDAHAWTGLRAQIDAEIASEWRLWTCEPDDTTPLLGDVLRYRVDDGLFVWLHDSGDVILCDVRGRWVQLERLDCAGVAVRRRAAFRAPWPLDVSRLTVDADGVTLAGTEGVVRVSADLDRIDRALGLRELFPAATRLDDTIHVPGSDCVWVQIRGSAEAAESFVAVDLRRRRKVRTVDAVGVFSAVGGAPAALVVRDDDYGCRCYLPSGHGIDSPPAFEGLDSPEVMRHPDGIGFVTLDRFAVGDVEQFRLAVIGPRSREPVTAVFVDADIDSPSWLAVSRAESAAYVLYRDPTGVPTLEAWAIDGTALTPLWCTTVSHDGALLGDVGLERVALAQSADGTFAATSLRRSPPDVTNVPRQPHEVLGPVDPPFFCYQMPQADFAIEGLRRRVLFGSDSDRVLSPTDIEFLLGSPERAREGVGLVALTLVPGAVQSFVAAARARFGDDSLLLVAAADELLRDGDAAVARRMLDIAVQPDDSLEAHDHRRHLYGIAALRAGDPDAARRIWTPPPEVEHDPCQLRWLYAMITADGRDARGTRREWPIIDQRAAAARAAAAESAAGQPMGAVSALDGILTRVPLDRQLMARRCDAWLEVDAQPPSTRWFAKLRASAAYAFDFRVSAQREAHGAWLPDGLAYTPTQMEAIRARCADWLDRVPPRG